MADQFLDNPPGKEVKEIKDKRNFEYGSYSISRHEGEPNEDQVLALPQYGVFALFDGVGGQKEGENASGLAAQGAKNFVEAEMSLQNQKEINYSSFVRRALLGADKMVIEENLRQGNETKKEEANFLASTGCLGYIGKERAYFANIGDSRVCLLRDGKLIQITLDDSTYLRSIFTYDNLVREAQERLGNIRSEADIKRDEWEKLRPYFRDPQTGEELRRYISKNLGSGETEPSVYNFPIKPGDIIIFTSDGIPDNLVDQEIIDIAKSTDNPTLIAKRLAELADRIAAGEYGKNYLRRHPDDKTALVISIPGGKRVGRSEEGITAGIAGAKNINQISQFLHEIGGIQGTSDFLVASEFDMFLKMIVSGQLGMDAITRQYGLREKIRRFLSASPLPAI